MFSMLSYTDQQQMFSNCPGKDLHQTIYTINRLAIWYVFFIRLSKVNGEGKSAMLSTTSRFYVHFLKLQSIQQALCSCHYNIWAIK